MKVVIFILFYIRTYLLKFVLDCLANEYGYNCKDRCGYCYVNEWGKNCDTRTGKCLSNQCLTGFGGEQCNIGIILFSYYMPLNSNVNTVYLSLIFILFSSYTPST